MILDTSGIEFDIEIQIDLAKAINKNLRYYLTLISIEDFIDIKEDSSLIDYSPYYQRNYVWDAIKGTFFMESVLLNAEIPPFVLFRSGNAREIIDGRQRYETILRFLKRGFKLVANGLTKLKHLAGKNIDTLGEEYTKILKRIQLRLYEYEIHNNIAIGESVQVLLKQEIFKRYNTGITPLTQLDIFKARYIDDILNFYFKNELERDRSFYKTVTMVLHINGHNMQQLLRRIRALLVLHHVPIYTYANDRAEIYPIYEHFSALAAETKGINGIFDDFKRKIAYLQEIQTGLHSMNIIGNTLIFQTIFWALSICNRNDYPEEKIGAVPFKKKLITYIIKNIKKYQPSSLSEAQTIKSAFNTTSLFFESNTPISFDEHLHNSNEFRSFSKGLKSKKIEKEEQLIYSQMGALKKELSVMKVSTLLNYISEKSFNIRPRYQRGEVINRLKASSIIESLLLGIELPPIFIFRKRNGEVEVIDGQQRLISCIAFLGTNYWNELGKLVRSQKHNFALNLKNGILKDLDGMRYNNLDEEMKLKISNSLIRIVEITEDNNPNFDPVDLFMRLNFKPYPIKDNTFESWNSFINKTIIDRIKFIQRENRDWLSVSKKNERMYDEELLTCLIYSQYKLNHEMISMESVKRFMAIYVVRGHLLVRLINKADVTEVLSNSKNMQEFMTTSELFERDFFGKIEAILSSCIDKIEGMDEMLNSKSEGKARSYFRFYILWLLLTGIPIQKCRAYHQLIKADVTTLLNKVSKIKRSEQFESLVQVIWHKYRDM